MIKLIKHYFSLTFVEYEFMLENYLQSVLIIT